MILYAIRLAYVWRGKKISMESIKADVKIVVRYVVIAFFLYLAYDITRPEYVQQMKGIGEIAVGTIYTSVFGVLGWIVKTNWETTPDDRSK